MGTIIIKQAFRGTGLFGRDLGLVYSEADIAEERAIARQNDDNGPQSWGAVWVLECTEEGYLDEFEDEAKARATAAKWQAETDAAADAAAASKPGLASTRPAAPAEVDAA